MFIPSNESVSPILYVTSIIESNHTIGECNKTDVWKLTKCHVSFYDTVYRAYSTTGQAIQSKQYHRSGYRAYSYTADSTTVSNIKTAAPLNHQVD